MNEYELERAKDIQIARKGINTYCKPLPKIIMCKYCRAEISKENTERSLRLKGYCTQWCYEIEHPPTLGKLCKCGNVIMAHLRSNGKSSNVYPKTCEECRRLLIKKIK